MSDIILEAQNLKKKYGDLEAVKDVSFEIFAGEIFSLLGPNGAGKTTLISMLSCLLEPTDGDAIVGSFSIRKNALAVKQLIGVVPQDLALYGALTARQNLQFWGHMYGMSGSELNQRIDELLEKVGLAERAGERVNAFSGGMKRRLNIAVGLLHNPKLVFMDEPTVGIDPQSRRNILDMVKELRDQGMTVLYTTHYMEEAEELSDRVGIIDHGELIALGKQSELMRMVGDQETLRLYFGEQHAGEALVQKFGDLHGVLNTTAVNGEVVLTVAGATAVLPDVVKLVDREGVRISTIDITEPNLEAVFLHLTGRALRD